MLKLYWNDKFLTSFDVKKTLLCAAAVIASFVPFFEVTYVDSHVVKNVKKYGTVIRYEVAETVRGMPAEGGIIEDWPRLSNLEDGDLLEARLITNKSLAGLVIKRLSDRHYELFPTSSKSEVEIVKDYYSTKRGG